VMRLAAEGHPGHHGQRSQHENGTTPQALIGLAGQRC